MISGSSPYSFTLSDGSNLTNITTNTMPYVFAVCPAQTMTYGIQSATNGSGCTSANPSATATVTVTAPPVASWTQNGNILCANNPIASNTYQWTTCNYLPLVNDTCLTLTQNTCVCLLVSDKMTHCVDTLCKEVFLPCDLSCSVEVSNTCEGNTTLIWLETNASVNAVYNYNIQTDSIMFLHFFGNDTISLIYPLTGCWSIHAIINDGVCSTTCDDTVCIHTPPTASWTQSGYSLCASNVDTGFIYQWFTCNYQPVAQDTCITISQQGCYCLVVQDKSGGCRDTSCKEVFLPCDLTCELIVPNNTCAFNNALIYVLSNASASAIFSYAVQVDSITNLHYALNDSIVVYYDTPGCWPITVHIVDGNCKADCMDTVCVVKPPSAEWGTIQEVCDSCVKTQVYLTGTPPWSLVITNGMVADTFTGITTSPFHVTLCPPYETMTTYTIASVSTGSNCIGTGIGSAQVTTHQPPVAHIVHSGDTLCALPAGLIYGWYACGPNAYLTTNQCFIPDTSGCYCVTVSNSLDCVDTACVEVVVAVNDISKEKYIIHYDPVLEQIDIVLPELDHSDQVFIQLFRSDGMPVADRKYTPDSNGNIVMPVNQLSRGIYFLAIRKGQHITPVKVHVVK
jgi:hypothetical protein